MKTVHAILLIFAAVLVFASVTDAVCSPGPSFHACRAAETAASNAEHARVAKQQTQEMEASRKRLEAERVRQQKAAQGH
jgi:hypothetical protein